jgi:hypothetical protein
MATHETKAQKLNDFFEEEEGKKKMQTIAKLPTHVETINKRQDRCNGSGDFGTNNPASIDSISKKAKNRRRKPVIAKISNSADRASERGERGSMNEQAVFAEGGRTGGVGVGIPSCVTRLR